MSAIRVPHARQLALAGVALALALRRRARARRSAPAPPITPGRGAAGRASITRSSSQEFGGAMTGPQAAYVEQVGKNIAVQSGLANCAVGVHRHAAQQLGQQRLRGPRRLRLHHPPAGRADEQRGRAGRRARARGRPRRRAPFGSAPEGARQRNSILGVLGSILSGVVLGNSGLGQLGQQVISAAPQLLTAAVLAQAGNSRPTTSASSICAAPATIRARWRRCCRAWPRRTRSTRAAGPRRARSRNGPRPTPIPASRVRAALDAGRQRHRHDQPRHLPDPHRRADLRRRSRAGRDRGQHVHPPRPAADLHRAATASTWSTARGRSRSTGRAGRRSSRPRPYNGNLETYVRQVFQATRRAADSQLAPQSVQRTTVNGLPAAYGTARVNSGQQPGRRDGVRL